MEPVPVEPTAPVPMALFDDVEPTVLLVFPDDVPLAFVWFLSRAILLLTSQHWLEAVPLDPELVPVPCAFAIPATAMSAAPVIAARQILFISVFPLSLTGKNADRSQCGRSHCVPLNSLIAKITRGIYRYGPAPSCVAVPISAQRHHYQYGLSFPPAEAIPIWRYRASPWPTAVQHRKKTLSPSNLAISTPLPS